MEASTFESWNNHDVLICVTLKTHDAQMKEVKVKVKGKG